MDLNYESVIIDKAKEGSEEAWSVLFKWNFKPVYTFCLQLAKGHSDDAEEITQQVFIIAAQKMYKFNPSKGTFRLWLFGISKNCVRTHFSKKKKKRMIYNSEHLTADMPANPTNMFTENTLVLETLARLPVHQSGILEAKYFDKKSMAQLAEDYKTTINAIGTRLSRAREKFKHLYQILSKQENEI